MSMTVEGRLPAGQADDPPGREKRPGGSMRTVSGLTFWHCDPRPEEIAIGDIAHALANLCRFSGHTREFYSVAQHSLMVARYLPPRLQLEGLLHDAPEAYLTDMPRPLKRLPRMSYYVKLEARLAEVIGRKYHLDWPLEQPELKRADEEALLTEKRDLFPPQPWPCDAEVKPHHARIQPMPPAEAKAAFLAKFDHLWEVRQIAAGRDPYPERDTTISTTVW